MGDLVTAMRSRVPAGVDWPEPPNALCRWVEAHGEVRVLVDGDVVGGLGEDATDVELRGWSAEEVAGSFWCLPSLDSDEVRVWPFCRTGGDGSVAALWLDRGVTRIVHLGSGSGSMLTCVLVDDAVDFLRLLAVGYDEICWNDDWDEPPTDDPSPAAVAFRTWVETSYDVVVPATALEVVPHPVELGDETDDPFCRLVDRLQQDVSDPG